jgi:hypothetical protein
VTGDDHNTDALIAALRSPALPAERAGEAAAVSAMLGVIARAPASTRFRASRGIAIAVVTVASLGVGGLAAAGPGVFQAAASKARSLVTADSADTESSADAITGNDPLGGSSPGGLAGDPGSLAALGAAASVQAGAAGAVACADGNHGETVSSVAQGTAAVPAAAQSDCGQANNGSEPGATGTPPECADGNHGDAVAEVTSGSVPPSAEQSHSVDVTQVAHDTCTPQGPHGNAVQGSNPNKGPAQGNTGDTNADTNASQNPGTGNNGSQNGAENGNGGVGGGNTPPVTSPNQGNGNANGAGNGAGVGSNNGQGPDANNGKGAGPDASNGKSDANSTAPTDSVPANNGNGSNRGNSTGG